MKETFVAYERAQNGSSRLKKTRLECSSNWHQDDGEHEGIAMPRHFAGCSDDGKMIVAATEMVELPEPMVLAILTHEFGHAMDFAYPAEYQLVDGELLHRHIVGDLHDRRTRQAMRAATNQWEARDDDEIEQAARRDSAAGDRQEHRLRGPVLVAELPGISTADGPQMKRCAGLIVQSEHTGRVLLLQRPNGVWEQPGGHLEGDEAPHETALREFAEETGYDGDLSISEEWIDTGTRSVVYLVFHAVVGWEFEPELTEHRAYKWTTALPRDLHPGTAEAIRIWAF